MVAPLMSNQRFGERQFRGEPSVRSILPCELQPCSEAHDPAASPSGWVGPPLPTLPQAATFPEYDPVM